MAYYGVFDGHAGPRASEYAAQHLHQNILAKVPQGINIMYGFSGVNVINPDLNLDCSIHILLVESRLNPCVNGLIVFRQKSLRLYYELIFMPLSLGVVQNLDREVKKCLVEAFKKTDEAFLQKATAAKPSWKV